MIALRPATIDDLALLKHWDEQPHKKAGIPGDGWPWEKELPRTPSWREFLIAELDGRPIAFVQIIDAREEETHYWGDCPPNIHAVDIWIGEASDLGRGYGTQVMNLALARCFAEPRVTDVWIDPLASNVDAIRFYERLGFEFIERRWFDDDDCAIYGMSRSAWESRDA